MVSSGTTATLQNLRLLEDYRGLYYLTFILAIMTWRTWPASIIWAIGMLVGISMLSLAARCALQRPA